MMTDISMKDLLELVTAIINSQKSGSDLGELVKVLALRETLQALRQPPQQQQTTLFEQMTQFAMAMKFWDMIEKKFGKEGSVDEFLKYMQIFQQLQKGQVDTTTLLQMINETHNRYAQLMKEHYESRIKDMENTKQEILNIIQEIFSRWDKEKLEMFQKFEETVKQLSSKGRFDELKKFLEEYQEYRTLEKQLKDLLKETELEKEPIYTKEGGINWEKILYYIDKWFFGGSGLLTGVTSTAPAKKEVKPPTAMLTPTQPAATQPTETPNIEVAEEKPVTKVETTPKKAKIPVEEELPTTLPELPEEEKIEVAEGK